LVVLEVETIGGDTFVRGMNRYAEDVTDWRPAFEDIYTNFTNIQKGGFRRQGHHGSKWADLSPRYKRWKEMHYPGRPILTRTGRMRDSMTGRNQAASQDTVKRVEKLAAEFGTQVPYAYAHQHGYPPGNLPARPMVDLNEDQRRKWAKLIQEWAWREANKAMGLT